MAATRFYFASTGTPAAAPTPSGAWDVTTSYVSRPLLTASQLGSGNNANGSALTETSATVVNRLARQHVSTSTIPVAKTIGGPGATMSLVLGALESATDADAFLQVVAYVVSGDGSTVRGTLYSGQTATSPSATVGDNNEELATSITSRIIQITGLGSVACQAGDLVVVELGTRFTNTTTSSRSSTFRINDQSSSSDYALTSGLTTTLRPWVEFSDDIFSASAKSGTASRALTVSTSATGQVGRSKGASKQVTISVAAAGRLGLHGAAAAALTVAVATTGLVASGFTGGAHPALSVTTVAAGQVVASRDASAALTVTVTADGTVAHSRSGDAAATLGVTVVADGFVTVQPVTVITWHGGRVREGIGYAVWDPPVAASPKPQRAAYSKVHAIDSVTITGARAQVVVRTAKKRKLRHRIIVSGKDVTFFRDIEVPEPSVGLVEPLLWGSGSITWPQIHAAYEDPGHGDLTWLKKDAAVRVQLVDPDTGEVIEPRYFVGLIADFGNNGPQLTTTIAGKATGRGSTSWRPDPIFTQNRDIGALAIQTLKGVLHLPTMDNAPTTGIVIPDSGSVWQTDYLTTLTARSTTVAGAQWTIMPDANGVFQMFRKNTTQIDVTVYNDDTRAVANLRRDFSEEPNREFATAIASDGMRIRFGQYAGLTGSDNPPAYPGALTEGDTGDGVLTLSWRLSMLGYLSSDSSTFSTYTSDLTTAVSRMQDEADLPTTGNVDAVTWSAAFDNDRTGWSLRRAHIVPAASKSYTRAFKVNASGQIIGRNPNYQRQTRHIDRAVDMGRVTDRQQARSWAENDLVDQNTTNYTGTLELHMGAVIVGEHNPGDPLDTTVMEDVRLVKPGMNVWLPMFRGGTLVHVASVDHDGTGVATLGVDTRARDALEVWEIHERNREAIRHPGRVWRNQNRSSTMSRDSMTGWDEIGGVIDSRVTGPANRWTVFPLVAAQEGQIRDLQVNTVNAPTEFVLAIFGKRITRQQLARLIGDPFTDDGKRAWRRQNDTLTNDWWLLYEAGWDGNPCGYHPSSKPDAALDFPDKTADALITGRWRDPAGFPYFSVDSTCIWVAFYPKADTNIAAGRIARVQMNDQV